MVSKPGLELSTSALIDHISNHLPPYAVPVKIEILDKFPRTSTGKINRQNYKIGYEQNPTNKLLI